MNQYYQVAPVKAADFNDYLTRRPIFFPAAIVAEIEELEAVEKDIETRRAKLDGEIEAYKAEHAAREARLHSGRSQPGDIDAQALHGNLSEALRQFRPLLQHSDVEMDALKVRSQPAMRRAFEYAAGVIRSYADEFSDEIADVYHRAGIEYDRTRQTIFPAIESYINAAGEGCANDHALFGPGQVRRWFGLRTKL